jgi:hypothetical protein
MTVADLMVKLEKFNPERHVCFANYLEETVVVSVTDLVEKDNQLVMMCNDGGELSQLARDLVSMPWKVERKI